MKNSKVQLRSFPWLTSFPWFQKANSPWLRSSPLFHQSNSPSENLKKLRGNKLQRIFLEGEEIRPKFRRYWLSIWHKFPLILSPILRPSNADILQKRSTTRRTTRRKWPGQYGFGNDWWINRSKMRLNQSEITILIQPKITITTKKQHYNNNTQYYHPYFGAI